jgi:serine O-acetyltransferase
VIGVVCKDIRINLPKSTKLPHEGIGVVIGKGVRIGKNCHIYPHVMIGRLSEKKKGYPKIGDNVTIYTGAVVVGNITIGNNVVIGANCFVCKDVPDNKIIKNK